MKEVSTAVAESPRIKCLLVDDVPENLLALSALLQRDDVEILTASSGAEALELLLVHEVALALLDVQMPNMDGFELAELMRAHPRTQQIPLIFVTAGARDQQRVFRGYDSGAVDFLFKPIEPQVLRNKVDVFFELYRQKRRLADELAARTESLRLYEMFTAVLSHDLRNPLSALMMSADRLLMRSQEKLTQDTAALMLTATQRMAGMIEDLLDLTRVRLGGGIQIEPQAVDLGEVVQQIEQEHRLRMPARQVETVCKGDVQLSGDRNRIAQLVSNLIGNALKHGDERERVEVRLDGTAAEHVEFCVSNKGSIAAGVLPEIFSPFRRADRTANRADGLGLGLFIVKQIVDAHRGSVEVLTVGADRTEFLVRLPRDPRSETAVAAKPQKQTT